MLCRRISPAALFVNLYRPARLKVPFCFLLVSTVLVSGALAEVKLPSIFSDHMVLQQNATVPVWGWAAPGEAVTVAIANQTQKAVADRDGKWMVKLAGLKPGSKQALRIAGTNSINIQDVLVGEVWICSGQSNMEFVLSGARDAAKEIAEANYPELRVFTVARSMLFSPVEDSKGKWAVCTPAEAAHFTAVGYFFGRDLHRELKVPVGLIHTSVGGSCAEAWTSREGLAVDPELNSIANDQIVALASYPEEQKRFEQAIPAWESRYGGDTGDKGFEKGWAKPDFDDSDWPVAPLPASFAKLGIKTGGSVWFRKELEVPADAANKEISFTAGGATTDLKTGFFNGVKLTPIRSRPPFHTQKTWFRIPAELVHEGKNTLAVRVYSHTDSGGIFQLPDKMGLPQATPTTDLSSWKYQIETPGPDLTAEARAALPVAPWATPFMTATQLFNGMVHPLIPYAMRGVIWYQGESNADRAYRYRRLLPLMIQDWRNRWEEGDFPFYQVQLAGFQAPPSLPESSAWAELREAQSVVVAKVPNTGMAVAIDVGEADDIHPKHKQEVGRRLALAALSNTYHRKIEYSGPLYQSMVVERGAIRLKFSHADGLASKAGELKQFAIAGEDQKFVWADAKIDGNIMIVSSPKVSNPVAARYAWANNPAGCNLVNAAGLPASPFRTDEWPGITDVKPPGNTQKH